MIQSDASAPRYVGHREDVHRTPGTQAVVARALLEALSSRCQAYCILTGYERLPESFETDIDFMVGRKDFEQVPALIEHVAHATGTVLFRTTPHEILARAYLLAAPAGPHVTFVQPDATSDYRHFGHLWLFADEVLASRRRHPNGFWIPGGAYEFIYYLIKRLNKRDFEPKHAARLSQLYAEDPGLAQRLLRRFWSAARSEALAQMAVSGTWEPLLQDLKPFRDDLLRHAPGSPLQKIAWSFENARHSLDRVIDPTGGWISLMGPDGCGKSSVIDAISAEFSPVFREIRRYHLRPQLLRGKATDGAAVVDPHGKKPRGWLASLVKIAYLTADYIAGYWLRVRPTMMRTKLVIFDRYFFDILVDTRRFRYGGPRWLLKMLAKVVPTPGLTILLNAPPEVLWSRKQEVPFEEVVRQQRAYVELAVRLPNTVVVNAAQPLDSVVQEVNAAILSYFAARTRKSLALVAPASRAQAGLVRS